MTAARRRPRSRKRGMRVALPSRMRTWIVLASLTAAGSAALYGCGDSDVGGTVLRPPSAPVVAPAKTKSVEVTDEDTDTPPPPAAWSEDAGAPVAASHDKFASAKTCATCHKTIYAQWSKSMHARGL